MRGLEGGRNASGAQSEAIAEDEALATPEGPDPALAGARPNGNRRDHLCNGVWDTCKNRYLCCSILFFTTMTAEQLKELQVRKNALRRYL